MSLGAAAALVTTSFTAYNAPLSVDVTAASDVWSEKGSVLFGPSSVAMSSSGSPFRSAYRLSRQLFSRAAAIGEHGDDVARFDAHVALAHLADQRRRAGRNHGRGRRRRQGRSGKRGRDAAHVSRSAHRSGFRASGGFSRRTSRLRDRLHEEGLPHVQHPEDETNRDEGAAFESHLFHRHRIVAAGAKRVAAGQTTGGEPGAAKGAMLHDRVAGVVRARGQEPA